MIELILMIVCFSWMYQMAFGKKEEEEVPQQIHHHHYYNDLTYFTDGEDDPETVTILSDEEEIVEDKEPELKSVSNNVVPFKKRA